MVTTSTTLSNQERLEKVFQALQAAQQLQEDRLTWGINHINLYVENVDGDWLERWGEDEEELGEKVLVNSQA